MIETSNVGKVQRCCLYIGTPEVPNRNRCRFTAKNQTQSIDGTCSSGSLPFAPAAWRVGDDPLSHRRRPTVWHPRRLRSLGLLTLVPGGGAPAAVHSDRAAPAAPGGACSSSRRSRGGEAQPFLLRTGACLTTKWPDIDRIMTMHAVLPLLLCHLALYCS